MKVYALHKLNSDFRYPVDGGGRRTFEMRIKSPAVPNHNGRQLVSHTLKYALILDMDIVACRLLVQFHST